MQHVGNVKSCFSCQNIKGPRREQLKEISWASKTLVQIFTSHEFTITNFLELHSTEIADPVLDSNRSCTFTIPVTNNALSFDYSYNE